MDIAALLIDLDGVLYVGDCPVEGGRKSLAMLRELCIPYRFISNTTRRSRKSIADRLRNLGYDIPEELIVTAPLAAVSLMQKRGGGRCFLLTTGDVSRDFKAEGITIAEEDADFVVVGDAGENFTYDRVNTAFRLLMEGAELIALEKDRYWMGTDGLMLSAGPFVTALEYASGRQAEVVGKPSREFFTLALGTMGAAPEESVMIGDDIVTDIGGAQACGIRGILVRTGKYREDTLAGAGIRPYGIIDSIAHIGDIFRYV